MTPDNDSQRLLTRLLAGMGTASGLALLVAPRRVVDAVVPEFPRERLWLVRALGARLVVQHGAVLATADPRLVRLGSAVDLAHAASMVPLLRSPRYRRAAAISGGLAAVWAAVAAAAAPKG